MDFESIEGLNEEELLRLYDENNEIVATHYGTYCKTNYSFSASLCANSFIHSFGVCPINCETSVRFSHSALQAKCNNYCNGTASFDRINAFIAYYYNAAQNGSTCAYHFDGTFRQEYAHNAYGMPGAMAGIAYARCYKLAR